MHHEILAQARHMAIRGDLKLNDIPKNAQRAAEIFFIGEDGNGVGPGAGEGRACSVASAPALISPHGRGAAFDFRNDAEAARLVEGLRESRPGRLPCQSGPARAPAQGGCAIQFRGACAP